MIGVLYAQPTHRAGALVTAALARSVSRSQVSSVGHGALDIGYPVLVAVDVPDGWGALLHAWLRVGRRKLIVFGNVPPTLADSLGWRSADWPTDLAAATRSDAAPACGMGASRAAIAYGERAGLLGAMGWNRAFERFDFADEWNNLGYGAIRADDSPWGLRGARDAGADTLATVSIDGAATASYAALADSDDASVLWFNRPVGPLDSFEWRVVENFIAHYRADCLPCKPVLREIPWGYDAAVTSRLDCDEDVESARTLQNAYLALGVPFSLAVHTANLATSGQAGILRDLLAHGGAVLSHTATHAPNWGGSYEAALHEGAESAIRLREATGQQPRYAVSPFHQSPPYALSALADVGYQGCIGGIIRNDPEFVLARGGGLAGLPAGFVGHSQQCMLHGECMLDGDDPMAVFKQAFDMAHASSTLFGYLDHPFSPRYSYGWKDEDSRVQAHTALISHIRQAAERPLFLNEDQAMDFLRAKSQIQIVGTADGHTVLPAPIRPPAGLDFAVEYKGQCVNAAVEPNLS